MASPERIAEVRVLLGDKARDMSDDEVERYADLGDHLVADIWKTINDPPTLQQFIKRKEVYVGIKQMGEAVDGPEESQDADDS